jgi:hypothetical protein
MLVMSRHRAERFIVCLFTLAADADSVAGLNLRDSHRWRSGMSWSWRRSPARARGALRSVGAGSRGGAAGGAYDEVSDQRGPARLVGGADTTAGVAVEVLVEGRQVVPVRVGLEEVGVAEDRAGAALVVEEDRNETAGEVVVTLAGSPGPLRLRPRNETERPETRTLSPAADRVWPRAAGRRQREEDKGMRRAGRRRRTARDGSDHRGRAVAPTTHGELGKGLPSPPESREKRTL